MLSIHVSTDALMFSLTSSKSIVMCTKRAVSQYIFYIEGEGESIMEIMKLSSC